MTYARLQENDATTQGKYLSYKKASSTLLGVSHSVLVFMLFIVSIVGLVLKPDVDLPFVQLLVYNLVCCLLYTTTAILVIIAGRTQKRGVVIASMVLSIIGAVFAGNATVTFAIIIAVSHTVLTETPIYDDHDVNDKRLMFYPSIHHEDYVKVLAVFYVLLIVYLALTVVSIWSSAIACNVTCCRNMSDQPAAQPVIMITGPPMQSVQAADLMPEGLHILQVNPRQGADVVNQQQGRLQEACKSEK